MNTLPDGLRFRLLLKPKMQHAASRVNSRAAETTEPMAIPAIAPLDRPLSSAAAGRLVEDDVGTPSVVVEVGSKVGLSENCGKTTF